MKKFIKFLIVVLIIGGLGFGCYSYFFGNREKIDAALSSVQITEETPFACRVNNGSVTITGTKDSWKGGKLEVPDKIQGYPVTQIGLAAFAGNEKVEEIIISDSVVDISPCAFLNCSKLKSVKLPSKITKIGYKTFTGCSSLEKITIPDTVTEIGSDAFNNCIALAEVKFSAGLTKIDEAAFYECVKLKTVNIPEGTLEIQDRAFSFNGALNSVSIPVSLTKIGYSAFSGCDKISKVIYPGTEEQWEMISVGEANEQLTRALKF